MPYENERQFIWRLGTAKDNGLIDMSWPELAVILNNELRDSEEQYLNESAYRKSYTYAKNYYDDVFSHFAVEDYLDGLREQKRELEKERKKLQTEKIEYNKWLREEARNELIAEKIAEAIESLEPIEPPQAIDRLPDDDTENASWILAFGDAHYGAEFEIRGLYDEVINEYSPETFEFRMNELFEKVVQIIMKENIMDLYVFDLGDQIDGMLRISQLMKLRYGVVESTIKYAEYMSNWLNELTKYTRVHYRQCSGNHSELRILNGKKNTFEDENMASVIYEYIKLRLADNTSFDIDQNPTGMIFEEMYGYHIIAFHGESKDLEQTIKDFRQIYDTRIDVLIAGHLHHAYSETVGVGIDVMRTPSIIGVDDYSLKLHKTSNAGATLFAIEPDNCKAMEYHIRLM